MARIRPPPPRSQFHDLAPEVGVVVRTHAGDGVGLTGGECPLLAEG
jgi:hypothetical protein